MQIIAAGVAAASVAAVFAGLAITLRRRRLQARLNRLVGGHDSSGSGAVKPEEQAAGFDDPRASGGINRRLSRSSWGVLVQRQLSLAGVSLTPGQFTLYQAGAGCLAAVAGLLIAALAGLPAPLPLLLPLVLGPGGFGVPLLILRVLAGMRMAAFEKQLPQALDSLAGTLQAGSALTQSIALIGREMPAPISVEFRRVLREMEVGVSLTDAMVNLVDRVNSTDVLFLGSAIAIQQRVGGDLAAVLREISHTIRERLRVRSETKVLTAQGNYSAKLITMLPVGLFIYLWITNRPYISQLLDPGIGQMLLGAGIGGIIVGYAVMKKIITIEV